LVFEQGSSDIKGETNFSDKFWGSQIRDYAYMAKEELHGKSHRRQEPFCVDHKTYTKLSTFVMYAIKFVGRANPITNFEFVEEYAKNNK
jgi:hypothetical protein